MLLASRVLVKLSSPGPLFFRQARIGRDGQEFDILKFRTMRVAPGAPEQDAAWAAGSWDSTRRRSLERHDGADRAPDRPLPAPLVARRAAAAAQRPAGARCRSWARGRSAPGTSHAFEAHIYRYGDRHRVKSGLTGWAQVQGLRGETSLQERVEWDNYYVENWSPLADLKIVLLTLPAILAGGREAPSRPSGRKGFVDGGGGSPTTGR